MAFAGRRRVAPDAALHDVPLGVRMSNSRFGGLVFPPARADCVYAEAGIYRVNKRVFGRIKLTHVCFRVIVSILICVAYF